jgi:GT2 family glycosyltransferase
LNIEQPGFFDYAGASGGHLDVFGFPFARGRIFHTIEKDTGQYDDATEIFWATGACLMLRRAALQVTGLLDDDFFAHMEEIDLCWRLHLAGYRVRVAPASVVRHQSGSTLRQDSPQKIYLNHRNSLIMLLKNYSCASLLRIFPIRLLFELLAAVYYLVKFDLKSALVVMSAFVDFLSLWPVTSRKRAAVQRGRVRDDRALRQRLYRRSIVLDYFVLGRKKFLEL